MLKMSGKINKSVLKVMEKCENADGKQRFKFFGVLKSIFGPNYFLNIFESKIFTIFGILTQLFIRQKFEITSD